MAGVRRKMVARSAVRTPRKNASTKNDKAWLAGGYHWHVCSDQDCRKVFLDKCMAPDVNGRCDVCRRGYDTPYMEWRYPKNCCRGNCELLDPKSEWIKWGRLAGNAPWFQCRTCRRSHGKPIT